MCVKARSDHRGHAENFSVIRSDVALIASGKSRDHGVCFYMGHPISLVVHDRQRSESFEGESNSHRHVSESEDFSG